MGTNDGDRGHDTHVKGPGAVKMTILRGVVPPELATPFASLENFKLQLTRL